MAYIDYDFYARVYRLEGRALTENEIKPILWDAATFSRAELWALFDKFGFSLTRSATKRAFADALDEALRIAPVFDAAGRLVAPRFEYERSTKTFRVARTPKVRSAATAPKSKRRRTVESKPRPAPPRDWEEYRRRNGRRKAANDASEA